MAAISQKSSPESNAASPSPSESKRGYKQLKYFKGCSKFEKYEPLEKLGEGTFGLVYRAKERKSGAIVAMKQILMHNEKDGFPITALREIKLLKLLSHSNILNLVEMAIEHRKKPTDKRVKTYVYMVTPYMDHDLSGLLENPSVIFTEPQIKCYMLQLLEGTRYLHDNHILHRDMKAANLLINNKGILQIADFGLARHYHGPVPRAGGGGGDACRDYTSLVVTRWYRPPELLLSLRKYTPAIDLWGVGCVFGEMLIGKPILAGDSDARQLEIIFDLMGSPTEDTMPGWRSLSGAEGLTIRPRPPTVSQRFREYGSGAISLLTELLKLDWHKRINAIDALKHPYFRNNPLPAKAGDIPHFEDSHELDRRKFRDQKAGPPPAPKGGTVGMGPSWGHDNGGSHGGYGGDHYGGNYRQQYNGSSQINQSHGGYRNGVPPPPSHGHSNDRRPAWANNRERDNGSRPDTSLPPRPPRNENFGNRGGVDESRSDHVRERDILRNRGPPVAVDTYIPTYGADSGRQHDRRRWDDREDRRHDRGRESLDYDDRSRSRRTRSRSRSPTRERHADRVRERDPTDRDRDVYSRR